MKRKINIIAIIPARAGSKSIKNKNLALLNNKPLIYYAINSAKKSKYINRIIVSTNSKKIKRVALRYGAEVPFLRPQKISSDDTLDYPVIFHAISKLKLSIKKNKDDIIVYLRPTQPLRCHKDIDKVLKFMLKKKIDSIRSVRKAIYPPFWMKKISSKNLIEPLINNKKFKMIARRQDLPNAYMCDGYVDAVKLSELIKNKSFPLVKSYALKSYSKYFVDIDDKYDLDLANLIMKNKK